MLAAVFPGQGSQKPGMGRALFDHSEQVRAIFDEISASVGVNVQTLCFETEEETLRQTQNAQLALYTCGISAYAALVNAGIRAQVTAGHSVGEYAALAAAGVVTIADGARLVHRRGEVMAASGSMRPGTMAAILGLEREALESVCREASTQDEVVVVANDNCPGQLVISGDTEAVQRACQLATSQGAKRALPLNVSGAFHSPLMAEPAEMMGLTLQSAAFHEGRATVYANVTARPEHDASRWPTLLEDQLKNPVRWTESVQLMIADGVTTFVECGVGEVLCGLIRRISKEVKTMAVNDVANLESTLAEVSP